MFSLLVIDRNGNEERFLETGANLEEDRIAFANILEQYMGREAKERFNDCLWDSEEVLEGKIEEEVIKVEEHYQSELMSVVDELDAIIAMFDTNRLNKEKVKEALKYLRNNINNNL